jgi:cyclopropane fatty-acyl-phospholipid synthase-like methyltransferase
VIVYPDEHYEEYARSSDFIRKHIFPGGHLPSLGAIREALPQDSRTGKPLVWRWLGAALATMRMQYIADAVAYIRLGPDC